MAPGIVCEGGSRGLTVARPRKQQPAATPEPERRRWHTGTVREVRAGVWRAWRPRQPDGARPSRTFASEAEAEAWVRGDVLPAVLLLGHWLDRWLALRWPTLAGQTQRIYREAVAACAPLAARPLAALTVEDWQRLTNALLGQWSRYHVAVWRTVIRSALSDAVPAHLAENPLARVRLPKPEEAPPRAWTQAEVDRLLAAAAGGQHEPWLLFSLGTGVRLGEARALLWADVDLVNGTATIRASLDNHRSTRGPTKTRRVRVIDLPDAVVAVLADLRKRQPARQALVFGHGDRAYCAQTYRRWLNVRCRQAGVPELPPHSARHTAASLALDAGVPVQDVAKQLGHSVQTCLRAYSHYVGRGQRRAANALGSALDHRFSGPSNANGTQIGTREAR